MPWDVKRWDEVALAAYRRLVALRNDHPALRRGGLRWAFVDDDLLCYLRETPEERLLIAIARAAHTPITLSTAALGASAAEHLLGGESVSNLGDDITLPAFVGPAVHVWALS